MFSSSRQQQHLAVGHRTEGPRSLLLLTFTNPVPLSQTIPGMSSRNFIEAMLRSRGSSRASTTALCNPVPLREGYGIRNQSGGEGTPAKQIAITGDRDLSEKIRNATTAVDDIMDAVNPLLSKALDFLRQGDIESAETEFADAVSACCEAYGEARHIV